MSKAGDLVDEFGPEQLTLTSIADAIGVTQPALYRHIGSAGNLWRLLGVDTRRRLAASLTAASVGRSGHEAVAALAAAWRAFARDHAGRYRSTDRHAVFDDLELTAAVRDTLGVIEGSLRGFGLGQLQIASAATTLRSAIHGFVVYELAEGHPDRSQLDRSFDDLVRHICLAFDASRAESFQGTA